MGDDDPFDRRGDATRAWGGDRLLRSLPVIAVIVVASLIVLMAIVGSPDVPDDASAAFRPMPGITTSATLAPVVVPGAGVTTAAAASSPDAICGLPGIAAPLDTRAAEDPRLAARVNAAPQRLAAALAGSDDRRAEVVGFMLSGQLAQVSAFLTSPAQDACGDDVPCERTVQTAVLARSAEAQAPFTDAIARMAAGSNDPFVYAIAVESCATDMPGQPAAAACQLVSPAQWARIEPDNAYAWLHVAAAA